ncbi:MAG: tetratricopeptide repeat protein, partial [Saprospiraceae bacterium]|nr:tetratricopeptide repeat protein [Saprospiraceae bacterium]
MQTFFCHLLAVLLSQAMFFSLAAQTPEKPLADMNWQEMTEKWEALSIAGQDFKALTYARAALEKARRDSSEASLDYGNSLDYLGYSLHHTGQLAEAERCFLAAVAHAREDFGENHEDYITRLSNLGMLHLDMCELAKAVSELEVVVHLANKNLPDDNPYFAIMVNNLGLTYERSGNLEKALEYYLQALQLTEKNLGKGNARYGIRLANVATIYRRTGKKELALEFNLQAQSVFENSVGKKHPLYVFGLNGLISSLVELSRYQEALAASDELLAIVDENSLKLSTEFYDFTCNIANLYFASGQYQRCADFSKTMLEKFKQTFPTLYSDHSYLARLAMLALEKMGKTEQAVEFALLYNRFSLDELRENFSEFTESEQLQLYQTHGRLSEISSHLFAVRHPEFPEMADAAYDYQMTIKGLSLANRRQLFQSLREHPDTQLSEQFGEWKRLQNEISRQYALTPTKRQTNLDSLLTVSNTLERKLAIASETFRLTSQNARWQDVQAALAPGEAAIEFAQLKNPKADSTLYMA